MLKKLVLSSLQELLNFDIRVKGAKVSDNLKEPNSQNNLYSNSLFENMYQISPHDFSKLNRAISNEMEKVLLKFVSDGKIKVIPDEKLSKPVADGEKRKRGRPRKIQTNEKIEIKEKRPRGRPRKVKSGETKPADGPKHKRGRPKKVN